MTERRVAFDFVVHFTNGGSLNAEGFRLDIPAGTAVRFEPGIAQTVSLVPLSGTREVHGLSLDPPGRLDPSL